MTMKKETSISALLSVTQQDMAMLLNVSRSLWSLYELGKRDLPLPVQQRLAEMLTHLQSAEKTSKTTNAAAQPTASQLERLLRENEFQRERLARKIATTQKKQLAHERLLQLSAFLKDRDTAKDANLRFSETIANKASKALEAGLPDVLAQQYHRQELLELEQHLLESKLQKLRKP